ncbi:protein of unknown function [Bradyrhizobium vignae]|uniref:Uncharacterized protein n=1 Tax=Bradyrhizobium vignae TaxID=1549949 RepID=A0A2U3Q1R0_9BRAD|nr:protein of unknown function [Bradyrhizobium vignae]
MEHDLGRVLLDAALVRPFAGLQRALDVNLRALLQVLLGDLAEPFIEDHDAMPFGLFLALAGVLVAPGLRGGDAQIRDRPPVLGAADFRILAEISNQNDLVDASRHRRSPLRMPLNFKRANPLPALLCAPSRRPYTLAGTGQPGTPRVIPTYSITIGFVPDLFFAATHQNIRSRADKKTIPPMEPFRVPVNGKNHLTFIKLQPLQSVAECGISETDSALSLGYGCLGISSYGRRA